MKKITFLILVVLFFTVSINSVSADSFCSPVNTSFASDTSTQIEGGGNAVEAYTSPIWASVSGAKWIWSTFNVVNPNIDEKVVFTKTFITGNTLVSGFIEIASDDYFEVKLNGNSIASEFGEGNFLATKTFNLLPYLNTGSNTLKVESTNAKYFYIGEGTATNNPGGVIFKLEVNSQECPTQNSGGGGVPYIPTVGGPTPVPPNTLAEITNTNTNPNVPTEKSSSILLTSAKKTFSNNNKNKEIVDEPEAGVSEILASSITEVEENKAGLNLSALALTSFDNIEWYCILVALAIFLGLYIISELTIKDRNDINTRVIFFIFGSTLSIGVLWLFNYFCPILPLALISFIYCIFIYFTQKKQTVA